MEKCRDAGVTIFCGVWALHKWRWHNHFAIGFGSRKLEYVDRIGDPKSIFEKLRFMLREMPKWMLPRGFEWEVHDCQGKLINPENGSTITGEGGDEIGRGGRTAVFFCDEAAYFEHPSRIDSSLSANTNVRIDVSTPNGPGNSFAQKRFSGNYPVFAFDWRDDPRKSQKWYDEFKRVNGPVVTAQEVDRDYTASIEGICIPAAWVRAAVDLEFPPVKGPDGKMIPYRPGGTGVCGLDVAEGGKNKNVLIHRVGAIVKGIQSWGQLNTYQTAMKAADLVEKLGCLVLNFDVVGVGAGVRGDYESSGRELRFTPYAINSGEAPTWTVWPDGKVSREKFFNLRAEMAWTLRDRFEKAFEWKEHGIYHPPEDMISIPNHPELIADLSLPLVEPTEKGKIALEPKKHMAKRGIKSPDFFDSLCLAFAPVAEFDPPNPREHREEEEHFYGRRPQRENGPASFGMYGLGRR